MPGPVLHTGANANCPHGGVLNVVVASPRVMVGGMPAAILTDQGLVDVEQFRLVPLFQD